MFSKGIIKAFQHTLGRENVFHEEADLLTYSYDAAVIDPVLPQIALRPPSGEALSKAIHLCSENGIPITVRGSGTNLSGGTIPHPRGAVVLTTGLNRILEINEEDMFAVVQPGVVTARFAAEVESSGWEMPTSRH